MAKKNKQIIKKLTGRKNSPLEIVAEEEARQTKALSKTEVRERMERINADFEQGFELLQEHPDTVAFFGSARLPSDNLNYQQARALAERISSELGVTIVTGGGLGIMEAANHGAHDAHGSSIGMTIELPYEHVTNDYVENSSDFYYFFSRKVALAFAAKAYVYFPGGFGTLDEFFEILTLKQTGKIKPIPIILVGEDFWQPLLEYIDTTLKSYETISPEDSELYIQTDDFDEIIRIISSDQK